MLVSFRRSALITSIYEYRVYARVARQAVVTLYRRNESFLHVIRGKTRRYSTVGDLDNSA